MQKKLSKNCLIGQRRKKSSKKRKLVVLEWVTLDGVFDANTMKDGYAPYDSEDRQKQTTAGIMGSDAFVMGKVTYKMLHLFFHFAMPSFASKPWDLSDQYRVAA